MHSLKTFLITLVAQSSQMFAIQPNMIGIPAKLTIESTRQSFKHGEAIPISICLRNTADSPLLFNARMLVNSPYAPKNCREITIFISDQDGRALPFESKIRAGSPSQNDFKTLPSGSTYSVQYSITRDFNLKGVTSITLHAIYQDGSNSGPTLPSHPLSVIGPIESNSLTLSIN